ncbi:MAG TPA: ComF family protein [Gemmatimonadales bacterium]
MCSAVEQLLLPAECLICRALLPFARANDLVCPLCRLRWRRVVPPWCDRCGQPEPHFGPCRLCPEWVPALHRARSVVWLEGGARQAIHALKYAGLPRIADDLADVMVRALSRPETKTVGAGRPILVAVPLAAKRLAERGYNQSEHLALALGRRWELPVASLLRRRRETASQTALTPRARVANVAGAFRVGNVECGVRNGEGRRHSALRIPNSALVLVDDVFTTGATLAECAQALARAGATDVTAVTFARAAIPDFN